MRKLLTRKLFKNSIFLMATALMFSFVSCLSDNNVDPDPTIPDPNIPQYDERLVSLRIVPPGTRGIDGPICDGQPLILTNGNLFLVSHIGVIIQQWSIVECDGTLATATDTDPAVRRINRNDLNLPNGVRLPAVPANVREVVIIGNTGNLPAAGLIDNLVGSPIDIVTQFDAWNVNVFDRAPLTHTAGNYSPPPYNRRIYSAHLTLNPTVARFEIAEIRGTGHIHSFTVEGIFIDNFHRTAPIRGVTANVAAQVNRGTDPNSFTYTAYTTAFGSAAHRALFDWRQSSDNWTGTAPNLTVRPGGVSNIPCTVLGCGNTHVSVTNVWSYQVFAQRRLSTLEIANGAPAPPVVAPPRIVIRLRDIVLSEDGGVTLNPLPGTHFITVRHFRLGNGSLLQNIQVSNIYRVSVIEFDQRDLHIEPNRDPFEASIIIAMANWNEQGLRPPSPMHQPNPVSGTINVGQTHNFGFAPATGGLGVFYYQWQVRTNSGAWTDIASATAATFSIVGATAHVGNLVEFRRVAWCTVETGRRVESNPATLTVIPPFVQETPASGHINQGATHNFGFAAATGGAGIFNYQWQISTNGGGTWADIAGATNATFSIVGTAAHTTQNLQFRRCVSGAPAVTHCSVAATLVVFPPIIQGNPTGGTITVGETHNFGNPTYSGGDTRSAFVYQWIWRRQQANGTWTAWSNAPGTSNQAGYTFPAATAAHANYLQIQVSRRVTRGISVASYSPVPATLRVVDGVRIGSAIWATRNLNRPGEFVSHIHHIGMYYNWGTFNGNNHYWPGGRAPGVAEPGWLGTSIAPRVDWTAATDPCPPGWRVPTDAEFRSLGSGTVANAWTFNFQATTARATTISGQDGFVVPGTASNAAVTAAIPTAIFLPRAGFLRTSDGARDIHAHARAHYWGRRHPGWPIAADLSPTRLFFNAQADVISSVMGLGTVSHPQAKLIRCVAE